jgi:hypothetical protein
MMAGRSQNCILNLALQFQQILVEFADQLRRYSQLQCQPLLGCQ